jgi:hypothetical protein
MNYNKKLKDLERFKGAGCCGVLLSAMKACAFKIIITYSA